jgi:hypothetical protein
MAEDTKTLSDEQVDQLNSYEPVKLARAHLLQASTAYVKNRTPELFEAVQQADAEYGRVFTERLREVIEHPPQPRSVATLSQERIKGFKK